MPAPTDHAGVHPTGAHGAHMDRVYRLTRHVYDATRRFFLFGRDDLLERVGPEARHVVEIGCGTARNLIRLARRRPAARLYGLDASGAMLATAERKVRAAGLGERVMLRHALAEDLDAERMFGVTGGFDAAVFSYSLSMMPGWEAALEAAVRSVRPGGKVLIVDFWDQGNWPGPLRRALAWWLGRFSVRHRPEVLEVLRGLEREGRGRVEIHGVRGRYAYMASVTMPRPNFS